MSESAARRLWPGRDAVGQTLSIPAVEHTDAYLDRTPAFTEARVIGIARDVLSGYLTTAAGRARAAMVYFPTNARAQNNDSLLVRVSAQGFAARRQITTALDGIAPSVYDMLNPMDDVLAMQSYPFEVTFWVAAFLGGLALVMTVSGIYGVMAYLVNQRTKETGIRVALGAGTGDVVGMVVKQSARLTLIGIFAGVVMALLIAPVFAHQIDALRPYDFVAYGGAVVVVIATAAAASTAPARQAVRIDPATALRCD